MSVEKGVIHQIWIGPEKPAIIRECMQSVRDMNPEFEYMEWNEGNLPEFDHRDIIAQCETPSESSDIMRIEIVRNYGGIYIDSDMLCVRPLYPLWTIANGSFSVMNEWEMVKTRELNVLAPLFAANAHEAWVENAYDLIPRIFKEIGYAHGVYPYQVAHDLATRDFQNYGRTLYPGRIIQWCGDEYFDPYAYLIHIGHDNIYDPKMLERVQNAKANGYWGVKC